MEFVNSSLLWALFFGLTPIIIYYLMRYRSLRVPWGANYVLERALERLRKKLHIEQIILIALRTLACLFLIFAFARPISTSGGTVSSDLHHVLVVDASYSMRAGEQDRTRWDRAKEAMKELVSNWSRGEKWSLLRLGHGTGEDGPPGTWLVEGASLQSQQEAKARIDELKPGEQDSNLRRAMERIREKYGGQKMDVYLFTDDQKSAWKDYEQLAGEDVDSLLTDKNGNPVSMTWMNPPLRSRENIAVTRVQTPSDVLLSNHPARVFVTVQNFSTSRVRDVDVSFQRNGTEVGEKTVSLLEKQSKSLFFDVSTEESGSHRLSARLGRDVLPFDNRMSAGVEIRDQGSVLVLQDKGVEGKFASTWNFLKITDRVQRVKEDGEPIFRMGPIRFSVCKGSCSDEKWSDADVILLDGSKTVTPELVERLRNRLRRGAGLLLVADANVKQKTWNQLLGEEGLMPGRLGRLNTKPLGGESFVSLFPAQFEVPALRTFETSTFGDVSESKLYAWHDVREIGKEVDTLMKYNTQAPFALSKPLASGRVVMLTAGLNGANNNLIVRKFFFPLFFRLYESAAAGTIFPRTLKSGDELKLRLSDPDDVNTVAYQQDGGSLRKLEPVQRNGMTLVRHRTSSSGDGTVLLIRPGGRDRVKFGVQGDRSDSDLSPMSDALRSTIEEAPRVAEVNNAKELDRILEQKSRGSEWYHWAVGMLLVLLIAEMLMELRFV